MSQFEFENFDMEQGESGPVECLGMRFDSDDERRAYFTEKLREYLGDPEFRGQAGFPVGEDEAILAMSDPPYYTACPNPWLGEFVERYGKPFDPKEPYHREPLAVDVSVGKTDALYKAHSYHTKVPHLAIVPSILHYTKPGDIVLDAFAGSGMTGVAAQFCGVAPADYRAKLEAQWRAEDNGKPEWGARRAILNDLSPAATFIAANYNQPFDVCAFEQAAKRILDELEDEIGWMYETMHSDGKTKGRIEYTVWSEVFTCPECAGEVVFLEEALDKESKRVRKSFACPHCEVMLTKSSLERIYVSTFDAAIKDNVRTPKRKPVLIRYKVGKKTFEKAPYDQDISILVQVAEMPIPGELPVVSYPFDDMWEAPRLRIHGITHTHQLFMPRAAQALGLLWKKVAEHNVSPSVRQMLSYLAEQSIWGLSLLNRYGPLHFSQVNRYLGGVYYVASQHSEATPWYILGGKLQRLSACLNSYRPNASNALTMTGTAADLPLPDRSVDYIFTDPPFGDNFAYSELNFLVEAFHGVFTNASTEAIVDRNKKNRSAKKELIDYQRLMCSCFHEYYRVLKPGRWITIVFSNTKSAVWNSIQTSLQETGFAIANVSALDKKQGSFSAVTTPTAVKQDLVISAYKPSGQLELNFEERGATEDGVWDFVREHLGNLPITRVRENQLETVTERDPRILYDRTVAFYVRHWVPVPLSSPEFQQGLAERFAERDGMVFLPEQAEEYDRKRMQMQSAGQGALFVEDERSAVDWLRQFLKTRPSKYRDIVPKFLEKLNESWKKWETRPELQTLLDQYFLRYDGEGDVPPQIHSYLSSNFKTLRNLAADDAALQAKARDLWYVPDHKNQIQVEQMREKHLLNEFWGYVPPGYDVDAAKRRRTGDVTLPGLTIPLPKIPRSKRLKAVRIEAVRAGFQYCFKNNDYATIIAVSRNIPSSVVENDDQLQMIVDAAAMRSGLDDE